MALDIMEMERDIVRVLKMVNDPEIPVNVYDLGLIYKVDIADDAIVTVDMTLTAPNCPMADQLLQDVHDHVKMVSGVKDVVINLVFDPPWDKDMMTEEAKLELGFL
ncbi:MAG: iron-sulfur cluster assembly protein [Bacteroidales bacterium]|jgi:FeS assembly SUF system protein|nr:iron-sulfur cluster assembly protein [Bacteroidales bacterium]